MHIPQKIFYYILKQGLTRIRIGAIMHLFRMELIHKHPLVAFREAHNLSQEQAGALVGISQTMWSLLETGKGFVRPSLAKKIEDLTGVNRNSLMNWNDNDSGVNAGDSPKEA